MVKIRLNRIGAHKKPFYRIVVVDSKKRQNGPFVENIGYYNPLKEPSLISIDNDKAKKWLDCGAQPTETVKKLLLKAGVLQTA
ncbi:MAG: 30S ribosomal protein S16 [Nitrospirae bacterium]|nr:30S ribosomal protein S16 [Nitrospirota bacterium]MBF0542208.1 30S ribosomal protein S16 [Nitrospirota bacterium]